MTKQIKVFISSGYANSVKVEVCLDYKENSGITYEELEKQKTNGTYHENVWYKIDASDVEHLVKREIEKEGYHITKNNRQKYPRLKFGIEY